jgi:hypothetical protein
VSPRSVSAASHAPRVAAAAGSERSTTCMGRSCVRLAHARVSHEPGERAVVPSGVTTTVASLSRTFQAVRWAGSSDGVATRSG